MNINIIFKYWLNHYPLIPLFATREEQTKTIMARVKWQSETHCIIYWQYEAEKDFLTEIVEEFAKELNFDIGRGEYIFQA